MHSETPNYRQRPVRTMTAVCAALLMSGSAVAQQELVLGLEAGTSENLAMAPDTADVDSETLQVLSSQFGYARDNERLLVDLDGNLAFYSYGGDTFEDEWVGGATFLVDGRIIPQRLTWNVTENFGQTYADVLQDPTPGNRQDINFFSTGPRLTLPMGQQTEVIMELSRADLSYEEFDIDNSRNIFDIEFLRQISPRVAASIGARETQIEFDDLVGFDFDQTDVYLRGEITGARSVLALTAGTNEISNESGSADGTLVDFAFTRNLSASSTIVFSVGRNFSSAGDIFRFDQVNQLRLGQTLDIITTPDPFEAKVANIRYNAAGEFTDFAIRIFTRDEEYETQTALNRSSTGFQVNLVRRIANNWEFGLDGRSTKRDFTGPIVDDYVHFWSAQIARRLSRTLRVGFRTDYVARDRDGDADATDNRYFVFINYTRPQRIGQ